MSFTLGFQVDLIWACNLKCPFCCYNNKSDLWRNGEQLSFDKIKSIFELLRQNPPEIPIDRLSFVGSGEPLLYKDILKVVAEAKRFIPYVVITTNGVLLTKDISEKLIDAGIDEIGVSITGATPDTYLEHQGSGRSLDGATKQFNTVKTNIMDLCKLKNEKKRHVNVLISTILHDGSKQDFFKTLNMWRDIGADMVLFRTMNNDKKTAVSSENYSEHISQLIQTNGFKSSCTMFGKTMQISPNGNLYICCAISESTLLGNIFETPITELLNSEKFKNFVNAFHGNYQNVPKFCKTCSMGRSFAKF